MFKTNAGIILLALIPSAAPCQPAPSFEVASIRLNKSSSSRGNVEFPAGGERFSANNVPLGALIQMAYNLTNPQCSCSSSAFPVLSERYDIQATAEDSSLLVIFEAAVVQGAIMADHVIIIDHGKLFFIGFDKDAKPKPGTAEVDPSEPQDIDPRDTDPPTGSKQAVAVVLRASSRGAWPPRRTRGPQSRAPLDTR